MSYVHRNTELLSSSVRGDVQMRGSISPAHPWDVMVDLFFYREPEEVKEDAEPEEGATYEAQGYGGQGGLPAPPSAYLRAPPSDDCLPIHSAVKLLTRLQKVSELSVNSMPLFSDICSSDVE